MRIGELSRLTGVSTRMLRYYEAQGLVGPQRRGSGYRDYAASDVARIRHVRERLAAGLSTATIADLLPCLDTEGGRVAVPDCPEVVDDLHRERDRLTTAIDDLVAARSALDAVLATEPVPQERGTVVGG